MIPSATVRIFDPLFGNVYTQDASSQITSLDYSFDANGCASATVKTNLLWEQVYSLGYYQGRNGIEISTADDQLQVACAAGATKLYVTATAPYDATKTLAAAQIDISDGVNPTYRIPVTGVGTDSGGAYVTIGAPIAGTGNNTSLPAYGVGATIYRRVYAGRIARKTRVNDRAQKMSFSCVGVSKRLAEVQINATFNTIDLGQAAYTVISNAATRFPDLSLANINSAPTIGTVYSGQVTNVDVFSFITSNLLATVASGDLWVLRVGHDRAPLVTRLYTSATNTYTFNVALPQRAVKFRPIDVETDDEDISNMANSVLVVGDTDPITKQPIQGSYQDTTSIPIYGEIDGDSVSNVGVKDSTTAANYGRGVLNSRSFPQASSSFKLFVRNDNNALAQPASPIGLANGDVVYGYENVLISGFDSTDISPNKCPDSGLSLIALSGPSATWTLVNGIVATLGTSNAFTATSTSGSTTVLYAYSSQFMVAPGQTYTVSGKINETAVTSVPGDPPTWSVWSVNPQTGTLINPLGKANGTIGTTTVPSVTFTIPAGVFTIVVLCNNNAAVGTTVFSKPNLNVGSTVLPYVTNMAAPNIYGLASSVTNHMDAAGDRTQTISFQPVEPDINASIAERVNAVVAQINATKKTPVAIDQYCVSADLAPPSYTYSSSSLVVAFPTFLALFAKGTNIVTIPPTNVTLPASSNAVYVFVQSNGTFVTQANNSAPVAGAILLAYFTTSSTGVIGDTFRASVGVIKIGVGNINVATNLPAPAVSAYTATPGNSLNGVAADVVIAAALQNVPSSATGVQWYYRQAVSTGGSGNWTPYGVSNLSLNSGSSYPSTSQTATLEFADLTKGASYDFAIAYESLSGFGPLTTVASSYQAPSITIISSYLLAGSLVTPTQINGAAITNLSANGLNASAFCQWQATNQPTDGSLSRVNFWLRPSALGGSNVIGSSSFNWSPYGGVPASGVGVVPGPANAVYSFSPADLMNSTAYDFGFSYENNQGGESAITPIVLSFTAAVLNLSTTANSPIPSAIASAGPSITSSSLGTQVSQGTGVAGQPFLFSIGDWTANNQPGWFAGFLFFWRVHGDTTTAPHQLGSLGVTGTVSNIAYSIPLGAGGTYDIGIAYAGANSTYSAVAWPSGLSNVAVAQINPPLAIAGTSSGNYIPDAQIAHVGAGGSEAYYYFTPGTNFLAQAGSTTQPFGLFVWKNGVAANRFVNSQPFTLQPGTYNLSAYIDLINASGSGGVTIQGPLSGSVTTAYPGLNAATVATLTGSPNNKTYASQILNTSFTITTAGTYCLQASNAGITVGGSPIYMGMWQVQSGAAYTGFMTSTPVQTQGNDAGTTALTAAAQSTQLVSTGTQVNLIADSDIKYPPGPNAYWAAFLSNFTYGQYFGGRSIFLYFTQSGGSSTLNWSMQNSAYYPIVNSGQTFTLSALADTSELSAGSMSLIVSTVGSGGGEIARITWPYGYSNGSSRLSTTFTIPSGYTQVSLIWQQNWPSSTSGNGQVAFLGQIQLEQGSVATAYKPNETYHGGSAPAYATAPVALQTAINSSGQAAKSTFLNVQGSIAPYTTDFTLNITSPSGATYVKYYICGAGGSGSAVTFYRADGTTFSAPAVGTSSSPIQVNVSATGQSVFFVVFVPSGGTTFTVNTYTPTAPTPAQVALAIGDGTLATVATATTYSVSGTGGLSGGGSGGCPEISQRMRIKIHGVEFYAKARALRPGHSVMGSDGQWKELHKAIEMPGEIWRVTFDEETIAVDASHLFMDPKGNWVNVKRLAIGQELQSHGRHRIVPRAIKCAGMGRFMAISIDDPFAYTIGRTVGHNVKVK